MSTATLNLDARLRQYLLDHSLREPEVLARLRDETSLHPYARMQISPEQGQFMALLARLMGARKALEVGTFTGYSAICVARALAPGGKVVAMDVSAESSEVARRYFAEAGVADRVDLRVAPALETLDALLAAGEAGTFDMAFIDADKERYLAYYERALQLLRPGGLILVDNTLWSGAVADPSDTDESTAAIREFNSFVHADERVDVSLLPVGDGLTLALKR
ncbi:MAG: class I SAM-dependent methyltransferase [Candidatus Sericytochromatia bacterium]|nr:class I SAM-dependent methyltransferase [Candidatus Tanganyikabacteria bacterium]